MWVLVLGLLAAQPEAPPLEEDLAFVEGRRLYDQLEPARAVFKFREALRVAGRSDADKATVHVWLGLTYAQLGEIATARDSFAEAITLHPDAQLPGEPSPKIVELFEEARASVSASEPEPESVATPPTEADANAAASTSPTPAASEPAIGSEVWLYAAGGAAAASVLLGAVGAVLGLQVFTIEQAANAGDVTQVEAKARLDEAEPLALGANVLFASAGVALVAAGALGGAYFVLSE